MKFFEKYVSNTYAASAHHSFFNMGDGEVRTGRVFYKISVGGKYNYSILFSNTIDSTYSDGKISHKNLIYEAIEEVNNSIDALECDLPVDMVSINIKTILECLGTIVGQNVSEETINGIFSRFCLGK